MKTVYLDYSATTPLAPEVFEAMRPHFLGTYGNASSIHDVGRKAKAVLEESRETIAGALGARHDELFFTGGGTESDNYAVRGVARAGKKRGRDQVVISAIEHHAVLHPAQALKEEGFKVDLVPVDENGRINLDELRQLVSASTALVSIMHANNEVGTIQPLRTVADIAHASGAVMHTDAVQSAGKIPVNVDELGTDLLSLSAHKLYGPKGIGAIYVRKGTAVEPIMLGGGQEQNRRPGTENVPLAAGFARAMELSMKQLGGEQARSLSLRTRLKDKLLSAFEGILVNGHPTDVLPTILSVSFDADKIAVDGEALIMGMDIRGVAVTSGSACSSGTLEPSHVLMAMGRPEKTARATIRFSIGRPTTQEDIDAAVEALREVLVPMLASRR